MRLGVVVQVPVPPAVAPGADARWTASEGSVAIGEPVSFELVLRLRDGLEPTLAAWPSDPLVPWALLEGPALARRPLEGDKDEWRARYSAFAMKGGELDSPSGLVLLGGAPLDAAGARVVVAGELAEGEDAPRALLQAPESVAPPAGASGLPPAAWLWLCAAPLVALVVAWRWKRVRVGEASGARPPAPLERLAQIEARWRKDPAEGRECLHALSALVRGVVDAKLAAQGAGPSSEPDNSAAAALGGMEWADRAEARGEAAAAGFVRRIEPLRWCCNAVPAELVAARFDEARALCAAAAKSGGAP